MSDLISRKAVLDYPIRLDHYDEEHGNRDFVLGIESVMEYVESLPSAEPKTGMVLCALADRTCPFQGKHFAWCLTCPHISEEDRKLVRKVASQSKTGEWIEVEVFPEVYDIEGVKTWGSEMQCDQCGFRHTAIEGHMAQYNFCPNCGARMMTKGGDDE